ncbi:hypothetical protein VTK26DRAFT_8875 [Humicola hyalothermophila]
MHGLVLCEMSRLARANDGRGRRDLNKAAFFCARSVQTRARLPIAARRLGHVENRPSRASRWAQGLGWTSSWGHMFPPAHHQSQALQHDRQRQRLQPLWRSRGGESLRYDIVVYTTLPAVACTLDTSVSNSIPAAKHGTQVHHVQRPPEHLYHHFERSVPTQSAALIRATEYAHHWGIRN